VPISSRTRHAAVLATAALLLSTLVWSSGAQAAPGADPQPSPHARARAEKLLTEVQQALAPKRLAPRKLGDPLPRTDLGLLMHRLQVSRTALSANDQAKAAALADTRPVPIAQGCADYTPFLQDTWTAKASTHFCLHYRLSTTGNAGSTTDAWAQKTLDVL